jgi:hypothetical protein
LKCLNSQSIFVMTDYCRGSGAKKIIKKTL